MRILMTLLLLFVGLYGQYERDYELRDMRGKIYGVPGATDSVEKKGLWKVVHGSFAFDTTALKQNSEGLYCYLAGLSASNRNGGGWFVEIDSTYEEGGVAFDHPVQGKQWIRVRYINTGIVMPTDFGAIPNNESYADQNRIAIQAAIDFAHANTQAEVVIPNGIFWVSKVPGSNPAYCIDLKVVRLRGVGTNPTNGSMIKLASNQDATVFYAKSIADLSEWWHHGRLENLHIMCNGDNNNVANGIDIYRMGEASYIRSVQISQVKGFGLKVSRSATAHDFIEDVSVFPATTASTSIYDKQRIGFWFVGSGQRTIHSISGDNLNPMIYTQGVVSFLINGIKYENPSVSDANSSLVWADTTDDGLAPDGNLTQIHLMNVKVDAGMALHSIFKITSNNPSVWPSLSISSAMLTGYDSLVVTNTNSNGTPNIGQMISYFQVSGNGQPAPIFESGAQIGYYSYLYFEDHLGNRKAGAIVYKSDHRLHIQSPRDYISLDDYNKNTLALFHPNLINLYSPVEFGNYTTLNEAAPTGTPASGKAYIYLKNDGSGNQLLLIKFANGDVDTLASSVAP